MPAPEIDSVLALDAIKIMFQKLIAHRKQLEGVIDRSRHYRRRCSRRLLKIAVKTATSEVAGRLRLIV
jgi:hypothetical protein